MQLKNFIFCFILFVIYCSIMDIINKYRYKFCKKKCSGKKCRNWQCKLYNECKIYHVQKHAMQILNAAGYELVDEDIKIPLPEYIPEDSFPVDFVRSESTLHFNNEDDLLIWSGLVYKHYIEFINKPKD